MSTVSRAGRNVLFKGAGEILSRLIYLGFFIYMARALGASDFGLYSFAFSFAGMFVILLDPGLNILLARDVAQDRSRSAKYGGNVLAVKMLLSGAVFVFIGVVISSLGYEERTVYVVLLMGSFLILNTYLEFFVSVADGHERMEIDAAIKILNKTIITIIGVVTLMAGIRLTGLLIWLVVASVLSVALSYGLIRRSVSRISLETDWRFLRGMMLTAAPIGITMIFSVIYFKVDVVMLSLFGLSNVQIGLYSAAIRFIEVLNVIPAIFVGGLFPILAAFSTEGIERLQAAFVRSYGLLLILAMPIVLILRTFAPETMTAVFGLGYEGSGVVMGIVIWTSLFIFMNMLLSHMIIVLNRQTVNAAFAFLCVLLNVGLNAVLIPRYGIAGAGFATVTTNALLFVMNASFIVRCFPSMPFFWINLRAAACGAALLTVLYALREVSSVLSITMAMLTYSALVVVGRALSRKDVLDLKNAVVRMWPH